MKAIARLQFITRPQVDSRFLAEVEEVLAAGVKWLQLRIKDEPPLAVEKVAREVQRQCVGRATLIINDHVAVAREIGADGVHLGQADKPVPEARKLLGEGAIIGGTAHTAEQVLQLHSEGVDYIGLGPYRFTTTKRSLRPLLGIEGYQKIVPLGQSPTVPIVAVGGITAEDVPLLRRTTAVWGVAVSGSIYRAADRENEVRAFHQSLS